jgi:hypothetical protein
MFGGDDLRDEIIRLLKDQNAEKALRIEELEKTLLSLTDRAAFAMRYPRAGVPVPKKQPEQPAVDLRAPFKPQFSRAEIEKQFERTA